MQRVFRSRVPMFGITVLLVGSVSALAQDASDPDSTTRVGGKSLVCDAGEPQIVECTGPITMVQLDGSGSFDPGGLGLTYRWNDQCGPGVTFDDPFSATPILFIDMMGQCERECGEIKLGIDNGKFKSQCFTSVIVRDTTPPEIACPPNLVLPFGASTDPADTGTATATDVCNPSPDVTFTDSVSTGGDGSTIITRTWCASDGCQTACCDQIIVTRPPSEIGDTVYCDLDNDGVQDPGEPGLPGVVVDLTCAGPDGTLGTADDVTAQQVTDASGNYLFSDLSPDICEVVVNPSTVPPGKTPGVCPLTFTIDLQPEQSFLDADFCFINSGEIGDTVYCDLDNDGVQDPGEPGLPGVVVDLVCAGPDGMFGTGDDVVDQRTTGANGDYLFTDLVAGDCVVTVDVSTAPANKVLGECPESFAVALMAGESFLDADFCFITPGEIGDTVFCDLDNDGVQDPGEPGIAGVVVDLACAGPDGMLGTADDYTAQQMTDGNGNYLFMGLVPDSCTVTVDPTTAPPDKVPGACPTSFAVELQVGQSFLDADFCFTTPGEIGDTVFCDVDLDGMQDPGEPGIQGVIVNLTCAGPDGMLGTGDDLTDVRMTDANGNYLFSAVPPGLCDVSVDPLSAPPDKIPGPCPTTIGVDLQPGQSFGDADFCFVTPPGQVGDTVFCDLDDDGLQDPGEPGIPGVRVDLVCAGIDGILGTADDFTATMVTDANGNYLFPEVPAGLCEAAVDPTTAPPDKTPGQCPLSLTFMVAPGAAFLDADFCFVEVLQGGEGCTPGYWKQPHHFDSWPPSLDPDMPFSAVFENAFPGMTLVEVLGQGGGGLNALGRHTVAALLNAVSTGVDYDVTASGVVSLFNDLFPASSSEYESLKDFFEYFNQQGCPLN